MRNSLLKGIHTTAKGLHKAGLMNLETMQTFDALCLSPVKDPTPREIKKIRLKEKVSQPVFAAYLNITPSIIQKWETGEKHPRDTSLKLLNIIAEKGLKAIA